jgi:hypothetical protein
MDGHPPDRHRALQPCQVRADPAYLSGNLPGHHLDIGNLDRAGLLASEDDRAAQHNLEHIA